VAKQGTEDEGQREGPKVTQTRRGRRHGLRGHEREGLRAWLKQGTVAALGNLDEHRIGLAFARVVLEQARAEPAGFDSHGGVDGGVVGVAIEDVEGDAVLLERLAGVVEGVLDDVAKEELAAMRSGECPGVKDVPELCASGVARRLLVERTVTILCR